MESPINHSPSTLSVSLRNVSRLCSASVVDQAEEEASEFSHCVVNLNQLNDILSSLLRVAYRIFFLGGLRDQGGPGGPGACSPRKFFRLSETASGAFSATL